MPSLSAEAIIAIVAAVTACSPSFLIIGRVIRRHYQNDRHEQRESQDIELDRQISRNLPMVQHVKHMIPRPEVAYFPTR